MNRILPFLKFYKTYNDKIDIIKFLSIIFFKNFKYWQTPWPRKILIMCEHAVCGGENNV